MFWLHSLWIQESSSGGSEIEAFERTVIAGGRIKVPKDDLLKDGNINNKFIEDCPQLYIIYYIYNIYIYIYYNNNYKNNNINNNKNKI